MCGLRSVEFDQYVCDYFDIYDGCGNDVYVEDLKMAVVMVMFAMIVYLLIWWC